MKKLTKLIVDTLIFCALCFGAQAQAQQYPAQQSTKAPQSGFENIQSITERHQAERKALREKQNAERLEIRLMHQKEMESLLHKQKIERRSAIYR